jgi:hypothetical protein
MPIILKSVVCELTYTNLISSVNIFDITVRVFKARKCCLLEECFKNVWKFTFKLLKVSLSYHSSLWTDKIPNVSFNLDKEKIPFTNLRLKMLFSFIVIYQMMRSSNVWLNLCKENHIMIKHFLWRFRFAFKFKSKPPFKDNFLFKRSRPSINPN